MKKKSVVIILIIFILAIALFISWLMYTEFKDGDNIEIKYGLEKTFRSYINLYFLSSPIRIPIGSHTNSTKAEIKSGKD